MAITPQDEQAFRRYIEPFGGELMEIVDGQKIVVRFSSTLKMMKVIDGLNELGGRRFVYNSKIVDEKNYLTISGR